MRFPGECVNSSIIGGNQASARIIRDTNNQIFELPCVIVVKPRRLRKTFEKQAITEVDIRARTQGAVPKWFWIRNDAARAIAGKAHTLPMNSKPHRNRNKTKGMYKTSGFQILLKGIFQR